MQELNLENVSVVEKDGEFYVTSLQVAEHFEKRHDNVLRDIANLEVPERFRLLNFEETSRKDSQGVKRKAVLLTRDGFTLLAMGFTGQKAMDWKIKYIEAFNAMERELTRIGGAAWLQKRVEGKLVRRPLTDTIQRFVQYAVDQGSENYKKNPTLAYMNFTKMEYRALFLLSKSVPDLRDKLSIMDLNSLSMAERIVTKSISDSMDRGIFYKEIFQICKQKVEALADAVGPSDQTHLVGEGKNPFALPEPSQGSLK